jgi:hypothetical protein
MKTEIQNKCGELWLLIQKENELKRELNLELQNYAETNRKFANGEVVMICDRESDREIGKGMVTDVKTFVHLEPLWLKEYADGKKFDADIDNLRYEIYAVKKDGTQSNKHYFHSPHFIGDTKKWSDVYIKSL